MKLKVGDKAPDFKLSDQNGKDRILSEYFGKWIVLYFYPKDNTVGCIKEACGFRDSISEIKELGVEVLGISVDSVKSHKKFSEKYKLPFPILADSEKEIVREYGVWGEKKFMGRTFMGTERTSFLIDPKGRITKIYENVNPLSHVTEVILDLKAKI